MTAIAAPPAVSQRLLITGASSGIGLEAAQVLVQRGHQLTLLCRTPARCALALERLQQGGADPDQLQGLVVDLADLRSVEQGCQQLLDQAQPFDALLLNAGLQRAGDPLPQRSAQGVEATFAVNHLAHQLIAMRLLPLLRQAPLPRLVITASDVHNPSSGGGRVGQPAALGDLAGLRSAPDFLMVDGSNRFDADKAYKDSKLCNVLLARELARRLDHALPVIAWSPGLVIPRSSEGFFRFNRARNPLGMGLFAVVARDLLRVTESVQRAGQLLADLAVDPAYASSGFHYLSNHLVRPGLHRFEPIATSLEAADLQKAAELWRLGEQLLERLHLQVG